SEPEKIELLLSKKHSELHSCDSPDCEHIQKTRDTILVLNGEGNYRVIPKYDYFDFFSLAENLSYHIRTSDVLDMRVKQDTIFIKYLMPDVHLTGEVFWIYDKENNRGEFKVLDPGILGIGL
ncbi:MAG: hypothetical protein ACK5LF_03450, partial [Bacteroides xylanisolvens]